MRNFVYTQGCGALAICILLSGCALPMKKEYNAFEVLGAMTYTTIERLETPVGGAVLRKSVGSQRHEILLANGRRISLADFESVSVERNLFFGDETLIVLRAMEPGCGERRWVVNIGKQRYVTERVGECNVKLDVTDSGRLLRFDQRETGRSWLFRDHKLVELVHPASVPATIAPEGKASAGERLHSNAVPLPAPVIARPGVRLSPISTQALPAKVVSEKAASTKPVLVLDKP